MFALASSLLSPATMSAAASCPTAPQPRSQQALVDLEHRWAQALERRDSAAIDCFLAPEFVDTDVNGELHDRAEVLAAVAGRKLSLNHLEDLTVTLAGGAAVVHGVNRVTDQNGKELARVRFTDVFIYRDGQWKAISGHETLVKPAAAAEKK